jgi:hypothetical protein
VAARKEISLIDFAPTDETVKLTTGLGAGAGIVYGMVKKFSFGKTALYAIFFGLAGAFAGNMYERYKEND